MSDNPEQKHNSAAEEQVEEKEEHVEPSPLDPQFPLLKEFAEAARGTFNHTQNLVLMCENIGATIDLPRKRMENLKLAAMYHDIGKMLNPEAFSENQKSGNLHDKLEPWLSYQLITRHVSDSVVILLNHGFPLDVIKVVSEHHGDSVVKAFYSKAKELDPEVEEYAYRYRTGRPTSIESLILMLCDVVESTSRSIYVQQGKNPDPETLVGNIFSTIHLDGQFNEVEIKLGRLADIQKALIADVGAKYHKREAYPDDDELLEEKDGSGRT